jgi:hypothetical protein
MVWANEIFDEVINQNVDDAIERISTIDLYFLTHGDHQKVNEDIHTQYISAMSRLSQDFMKHIGNDTKTYEIQEITPTVTIFPKFGVYITNKGMERGLLADNLSGVRLRLALPIVRDLTGCPPC